MSKLLYFTLAITAARALALSGPYCDLEHRGLAYCTCVARERKSAALEYFGESSYTLPPIILSMRCNLNILLASAIRTRIDIKSINTLQMLSDHSPTYNILFLAFFGRGYTRTSCLLLRPATQHCNSSTLDKTPKLHSYSLNNKRACWWWHHVSLP